MEKYQPGKRLKSKSFKRPAETRNSLSNRRAKTN